MSLLGTLAKIGGIAAAPFTGGASLPLAIAGAAAPILGGLAAGRTQGRQAEAAQILNEAQLRQRLAELEAERTKFELSAPTARAHQAALGDFLSGAQAASLGRYAPGSNMPTMAAARNLFGAHTQAAGAKLGPLAVSKLGTDTYALPSMPKMPQANMFDKILGIAAPAAAGLGALNTFRNRPIKMPTSAPPLYVPPTPDLQPPFLGWQDPLQSEDLSTTLPQPPTARTARMSFRGY